MECVDWSPAKGWLEVLLGQGRKRLGDETNSPLFKRYVKRRRTGTSALSALPVRLVAGKIYLSTNRKSHHLSLYFSQPCTMIKTLFYSPGLQLKMFMSVCILANLFHSKLPKKWAQFEGFECLLLPENMTRLSFLVSFTRVPTYSTLNLTYIKGRQILHNIIKN